MKLTVHHTLPLLAVTLALAALGGCGKPDDRTAGQQVDAALGAARTEAAQLEAGARRGVAEARQATQELARDAQQAANEAGAKIGSSASDAALIAAVNIELARDASLEPGMIDVDVAKGRVVLRGTAPDAESVTRARTIVLAIKGVTGVDNYLSVRKP